MQIHFVGSLLSSQPPPPPCLLSRKLTYWTIWEFPTKNLLAYWSLPARPLSFIPITRQESALACTVRGHGHVDLLKITKDIVKKKLTADSAFSFSYIVSENPIHDVRIIRNDICIRNYFLTMYIVHIL